MFVYSMTQILSFTLLISTFSFIPTFISASKQKYKYLETPTINKSQVQKKISYEQTNLCLQAGLDIAGYRK